MPLVPHTHILQDTVSFSTRLSMTLPHVLLAIVTSRKRVVHLAVLSLVPPLMLRTIIKSIFLLNQFLLVRPARGLLQLNKVGLTATRRNSASSVKLPIVKVVSFTT